MTLLLLLLLLFFIFYLPSRFFLNLPLRLFVISRNRNFRKKLYRQPEIHAIAHTDAVIQYYTIAICNYTFERHTRFTRSFTTLTRAPLRLLSVYANLFYIYTYIFALLRPCHANITRPLSRVVLLMF